MDWREYERERLRREISNLDAIDKGLKFMLYAMGSILAFAFLFEIFGGAS